MEFVNSPSWLLLLHLPHYGYHNSFAASASRLPYRLVGYHHNRCYLDERGIEACSLVSKYLQFNHFTPTCRFLARFHDWRYPEGSERFTALALRKQEKSRWLWFWGVLATGLAGVGVVVFRGCWHRKMSWPVRAQKHSYQVCLDCGIKRLFDEAAFRAYGPYSYDLNSLIAWDGSRQPRVPASDQEQRTAS
jgi:hypothetical protein